jgi:hypothetical protein
VLRRLLLTMLQAMSDAEATAHVGAAPHERTESRTTQRNGTRDKLVATTAGDLTVTIPKVRSRSFFPSLLAPRRRINVTLHAVVLQAWWRGVHPQGRRPGRRAGRRIGDQLSVLAVLVVGVLAGCATDAEVAAPTAAFNHEDNVVSMIPRSAAIPTTIAPGVDR